MLSFFVCLFIVCWFSGTSGLSLLLHDPIDIFGSSNWKLHRSEMAINSKAVEISCDPHMYLTCIFTDGKVVAEL